MTEILFDPKQTALVTIDLQKGIADLPLTPHAGNDVIARNIALGQKLRAVGGLIVGVRVVFARDSADRPKGRTDVVMAAPPGGYAPDWGQPMPAMAALPPDVEIIKRNWSAFYGTELDLQLRRRGITTILLAGIATNFGVEGTARDGWQANYQMIVVEDGCSSYGDGLHDFSIKNILPRLARIRSSAEVLGQLA